YIYTQFINNEPLNNNNISKQCYTSTATITRNFKSYGFDGFNEFKYILKNEEIGENPHSLQDSLDNEIMIQPIYETAKLNSKEVFNEAMNLLVNAGRIYIVGIGGNTSVCYELQTRLERIGIPSSFHTDHHLL